MPKAAIKDLGVGEPCLLFNCPGCGHWHEVTTWRIWTFNGNVDAPSLTPSVNNKVGPFPDGHIEICHFVLTDGKVSFCNDCTHDKRNQVLDLPEWTQQDSLRHGLVWQ